MKQIVLAVHFPGVNHRTVWNDPTSGSQIDFGSFTHLAKTAERGLFDFFFLAEGLRVREQRGKIHDLDVVGRPDALTLLSALAAVTTHLGLAGTVNATFNEPYDVARKLATLDHLSGGRAAWNVVTTSDAFTGENFRRSGFLDHAQRYERAEEMLSTVRELWDSTPGSFTHHGKHFSISGRFNTPRPPQGHPVIIQAGDSEQGRDFAAASANVIFTGRALLADCQAFYQDVKSRLPKYGRAPGDLKILPAVTCVLGETSGDAEEKAAHIRRGQISPQTAIAQLEQVWNRDLSGYDPEGPLPDVDPDLGDSLVAKGRVGLREDRLTTARKWRALAEEKKLGIRDLVIEINGRQQFVGTAADVAAEIDAFVQADGADGFILVPPLIPAGLDEFVDQVVPLLQERKVFRTEYGSATLRGNLGLDIQGSIE